MPLSKGASYFQCVKSGALLAAIVLVCGLGTMAHADSGGGSSGKPIFEVPVRFSLSAGYHYSPIGFDQDRNNDSISYFGVGADFNLPIPAIRTLFGITGWYAPKGTSGPSAKSSMLVVGAYAGYMGEQNEIFLGPAVGAMSTTLNDAAALPNYEVDVYASSACGFGGWRHYFSKGGSTGFGINGYYCSASSYSKRTQATNQVETNSTVTGKATSGGGFVYLLFGWNDKRTIL